MSGFDRRAFADDGHWFLNKYECDCGTEWSDGWACTVDDDCPTCGTSTSPTSSEDQTADVIDGDADLARMVKLDDGDGRRFELAHLFTLPATDDEIMTAAVVELLKAGDGAAFCARCLGELFYGETQEEAFKNAADFAKDADGDPEDISVRPIYTEMPEPGPYDPPHTLSQTLYALASDDSVTVAARIETGVILARAVIAAWSGGDLAGAVNALEEWADETEEAFPGLDFTDEEEV